MPTKKFIKGQSGNPKGKPKGSKSAKVKAWEKLGEYLLNDGAEQYKEELLKLRGASFLKEYSALLNYFRPKLSQGEHNIKSSQTIIIDLGDGGNNKD